MPLFTDIKQRIARGLLQAAGIRVIGSGAGVVNAVTYNAGNDDSAGDGHIAVITVAAEAWSNIKAGATHNNPLITLEPAVILNAENGDNSRQDSSPRTAMNTVWKKGADGNTNPSVHIKNSHIIWNTAQSGVSIDGLIRNEVPINYLFSFRSEDLIKTGCYGHHPVRGAYLKVLIDGVPLGIPIFTIETI